MSTRIVPGAIYPVGPLTPKITPLVLPTTWVSNGADVGGSGSYVSGTQSVQYIHDTFAAPGDTIQIPSGTFTWSTGVNITKAIKLLGTGTAGATNILANSNFTACVTLNPPTTGVMEFGWVSFGCASGVTNNTANFVIVGYTAGSNLPPVLVHDCVSVSNGQMLSQFRWEQNGGICYKCSFDSSGGIDTQIQVKMPSIDRYMQNSTMGMAGDPQGKLNFYCEDCTFKNNLTEATDVDEGGRAVFRHNTFIDASNASHGYDTGIGVRHWEYYDNTFIWPHGYFDGSPSGPPPPANQAWLTLRGGTGVVTGNSFMPIQSQYWGNKATLNWLTDGVTQGSAGHCYTSYPAARQIGQGYSTTRVATTTTASFTIPAASATVPISVANATGFVVGSTIWIYDGTTITIGANTQPRQLLATIQSIAGNTITIQNPGNVGQPTSGTMASGAQVATTYSYPQEPSLGNGNIVEPAYVWGNTMDNTYGSGSFVQSWIDNTGCSAINPGTGNPFKSSEFIVSGRDFFLDSGAKPGWSRYTYPHPLRADQTSGGGGSGGGGGGGTGGGGGGGGLPSGPGYGYGQGAGLFVPPAFWGPYPPYGTQTGKINSANPVTGIINPAPEAGPGYTWTGGQTRSAVNANPVIPLPPQPPNTPQYDIPVSGAGSGPH
jgi:uncharacterized membrane protein YgcG